MNQKIQNFLPIYPTRTNKDTSKYNNNNTNFNYKYNKQTFGIPKYLVFSQEKKVIQDTEQQILTNTQQQQKQPQQTSKRT